MRTYWMMLAAASIVAAGGARAAEPAANDLLPAVPILADGKPIDVDVGHAAPFLADLDGSGKLHLLVGQFGDGKLRIYRNAGTKTEPRFDKFAWFQAGGGDGKVPSG